MQTNPTETHALNNPLLGAVQYLIPGNTKPAVLMHVGGQFGIVREPLRKTVTVHAEDVRGQENAFSLEENAFLFTRHRSQVRDFDDNDQIENVYNAEIEALLKDVAGVKEVAVFDHTVRKADEAVTDVRRPVPVVHGDYTDLSGPQRLLDILGEDRAKDWAAGRYGILNVWRPINGPIETAPLGFLDAASLADGDMVPTDLIYPDRIGEIYNLTENPQHRWVYLSAMEDDEVAVIRTYESSRDNGARFSVHSALNDVNAPRDAKPRESIETRALVRY